MVLVLAKCYAPGDVQQSRQQAPLPSGRPQASHSLPTCSLRVYDTPLEAFHQAGYGGEDAAGSAAAADGMDAANGTPAAVAHQPAGQRTPAQPPGAQQQQQQQGDSLSPALRLQCGELLYDYCWFSGMTAADPASCCLATTGRAQPVHLWDALSGEEGGPQGPASLAGLRLRGWAVKQVTLATTYTGQAGTVHGGTPPCYLAQLPADVCCCGLLRLPRLQASCGAHTEPTTTWMRWRQLTAWPSAWTAPPSTAASTSRSVASVWSGPAGGRGRQARLAGWLACWLAGLGSCGHAVEAVDKVRPPPRLMPCPWAILAGTARRWQHTRRGRTACQACLAAAASPAAGAACQQRPARLLPVDARVCCRCRPLSATPHNLEATPPPPAPAGIVSCMALNPDREGMLAAGSYSGAGLLLDTRTRGLLCLLEGGHSGGLTHVRGCCGADGASAARGSRTALQAGCLSWPGDADVPPRPLPPSPQLCFSADGNFLYTGARKDPAILCWDVRYSSGAAPGGGTAG